MMLIALLVVTANAAYADTTAAGMPDASGMPDAEMMAKWQQNATPNENHKVLEPLIGNWSHAVKWRTKPDGEFTETTGNNINEWILGGRFLRQTVTGMNMGQPFEGLGITGYDNVKQEYNSVWMDSMGTGMMIATGKFDGATSTISETGTFSCPITGEKDMPFRSEWNITGPDGYTYAMYATTPEGTEYKAMEAFYTRQP